MRADLRLPLRRAHPFASLLAILGLPASGVGLAIGALFAPGAVWPSLGLILGAVLGFALQVGGGLTSNVRQPMWPGVVAATLALEGAVATALISGSPLLGFPRLAIIGVATVGMIPGIVCYSVLFRLIGRPSVSLAQWKTLRD